MFIFYKFKKTDNHWYVIFMDEKGNYKFIKDDRDELITFLNQNKGSILIGANNFKYDDILLTSVVKGNSTETEVNDKDRVKYLPRTLDVTEGISRNYLVPFNRIVCSMTPDGNLLENYYAVEESDIEKELVNSANMIRLIYNSGDRKDFINWKINVIKNYNLPKEYYYATFKSLMTGIIGLDINESGKITTKFTLDKRLINELKRINDPFLNNVLDTIRNFYDSEDASIPEIYLGKCRVKINKQGIIGSVEEDYYETDSKSTFLYIDFNSFLPTILTNNDWLNAARYPERYKEVKELRLALKGRKQVEQLYYKNILNSGLNDLNKATTKDGYNIGISLAVSGIMTMLLLYKNMEKYGIDLIECNTDGLIIKCPNKFLESVKEEVRKIEQKLSLSCDIDIVNKIIHFDEQNYIMQFENGKTKHIGVFGPFQENEFNCSSVKAIDEALRNYYMDGIPVTVTLRKLLQENNLKAFQIIKNQKGNERTKYVKSGDRYVPCPCSINRLFAIRRERLNNSLYVTNRKGEYEVYSEKRGRRVKDGYYYFELADTSIPSINDLDLTYYIDKCYKVINAHPKKDTPSIILDKPKFAFMDLDDTLIKMKSEELQLQSFTEAAGDIVNGEELNQAYSLFLASNGNLLIQFLSLCKKTKGYGTIDNFARFLMSKELFPKVKKLETYKVFIAKYLLSEQEHAHELEVFSDTRPALEKLQEDGYKIILYSNWFKSVQETKLQLAHLYDFFNNICTIDEYYAKTSVNGWNDILQRNSVNRGDLTIMVGNGSSDLVPKTLEIPSIIVRRDDRQVSKKVAADGIIVNSLSTIGNPYFIEESCGLARRRQR